MFVFVLNSWWNLLIVVVVLCVEASKNMLANYVVAQEDMILDIKWYQMQPKIRNAVN